MDKSWERFFRYTLTNDAKLVGWRKAGDDELDFAGKYLVAEYEPVGGMAYAINRLWPFETLEQAWSKLTELIA